MKRFLILFLMVILLVAVAVPASAAGTATLVPSTRTVYRGGTVTVTVKVSGLSACRTGGIEVSYGSGLELVSGKWLISAPLADFSTSSKDGVFALDSAQNISGNIFQMTFKATSNASFASNQVSVKLVINNEQVALQKAETITVACNHKYGNWAKWSATTHRRVCSICGNAEVVAHAYANACDTTCDVCAAVRSVSDHVYSEEYTADETGHWFACINCGEKKDFVEHTPGEEAGEYTPQICTVCEFVINPAKGHIHKYTDEYLNDGESHWQVCTGCGEDSEKIAHTYDGECHEACNAGCGYERRTLHNESEQWESNELDHWKVCQDCQDEVNVGEHIWNQSTVTVQPTLQTAGEIVYKCAICQGEKIEVLPQLTLLQAIPWWGWIAAGFVVGAGVVTIITVIVISVKSKHNQKGRFSN